jgi:predicted DNA-binding transcriptional regulator YafY
MVIANVTYLRGSEENVSRSARLLELLVRVQTKPRFTAQELAEEFGVSRRTMLRDLHALSGIGVPLRSTRGRVADTRSRGAGVGSRLLWERV